MSLNHENMTFSTSEELISDYEESVKSLTASGEDQDGPKDILVVFFFLLLLVALFPVFTVGFMHFVIKHTLKRKTILTVCCLLHVSINFVTFACLLLKVNFKLIQEAKLKGCDKLSIYTCCLSVRPYLSISHKT